MIQREMTLIEYCSLLPKSHLANKQLNSVIDFIELLLNNIPKKTLNEVKDIIGKPK